MEDLIGLLIFLIFIGSRLTDLLGKGAHKKESPAPKTAPKPQPKRPTLADWLEETERQLFPKEPIPPAPMAPPAPAPAVKPTFTIHPPQPERTSITGTTLREPSKTAEVLIGPGDLKRAIVIREILGPPRCKQKRGHLY